MKKIYAALIVLFFAANSFAQNVGIGTNNPQALLDVNGALATRGSSISPFGNVLNIPANVSFVVINSGSATDTISCFFPSAYVNGQRLTIYNNGNLFPLRFAGVLIPKNQVREFICGTPVGWSLLSGALINEPNSLWYAKNDSITYTDKKYVGINTDYTLYPQREGIQANGSLLIHQKMAYTNAAPTAAQTLTMNNSATLVYNSDSIVRIYDPGGSSNYTNNTQGNIGLTAGGGYQISFNPADFGIAAGDTLWISETNFPSCRTNYIQRFTNTTVVPASFTVNDNFGDLFVLFRSNADNINDKGFDMSCKALYPKTANELNITPVGVAIMFNASNGSFMAGNNNKIGVFTATAIGYGVNATGGYSTAMGSNTTAAGESSTAMGFNTIAAGQSSTVTGYGTTATGAYATAMGAYSNADGIYSTAMGINTTASGDASTAMGYDTRATGYHSTAIGDNTIASNFASTSMGSKTTATGQLSTAMGYYTNAKSFASTALGAYNDSIAGSSENTWVATDPLLYVGNSQSGTPRSNAMVVYKNANVDMNGYTRLGKSTEGAPVIKMKKLTVQSSGSLTGEVGISHALNSVKIISVTALLEWTTGTFAPPEYSGDTQLRYNFYVTPTEIRVRNNGTGGNLILNKSVTILITYQE